MINTIAPPKPQLKKEGVDMRDGRVEFVQGPVRLLGDRILVKPVIIELSATLVAVWVGKTMRGEVMAVGPGEYPNVYNRERSKVHKSPVFRPTEVKVGDVVELGGYDIGGYAFPRIMVDGVECVIASEKDVCGYIRAAKAA